MSDKLHLELTRPQALVLYEWLATLDEEGRGSATADSPEQRVLWILEGQLEKRLPAVLAADYGDQLESARRAVHQGD